MAAEGNLRNYQINQISKLEAGKGKFDGITESTEFFKGKKAGEF
jgi:hypothetical protein